MIGILLVDDHSAFRESLAFLIDHQEGMRVTGQAGSLDEARVVLRSATVDIAVVDLSLPDGDGADLIRDLRRVNPHGAVLVLTASAKRDDYARAAEAGAGGICHKTASVDEVVDSIRRLHAGQALLGPEELIDLLRLASQQRERDWAAQGRLSQLTKRERQVLGSLAAGLHDKEIAEQLNVSPDTVRTHMVSILAKLGVDSRLQALLFAVRHGAIRFDQIASTPS
jgi:DNA-binding NarL/FixJ family response regulator